MGGSWYQERMEFLLNEQLYETLKKYNVKFVGARRLKLSDDNLMKDWFVDGKIDIHEMAKYTAGAKLTIDVPRNEFRDGIFKLSNRDHIAASCLSPRVFECALAKTICLTI